MFVPEDGSGLPNANSYADRSFADNYFSLRNITAWVGTDEQKEGWLVQATDYIDLRFGPHFLGTAKSDSQALRFPRIDIEGYADFPDILLKATCEYALRAKSGPLMAVFTPPEGNWEVESMREKVGPLDTEYRYSVGRTVTRSVVTVIAADFMLRPLLRRAGNQVIRQ